MYIANTASITSCNNIKMVTGFDVHYTIQKFGCLYDFYF